MNYPEFIGPKVGKYHQEFMEDIYKILDVMGVS